MVGGFVVGGDMTFGVKLTEPRLEEDNSDKSSVGLYSYLLPRLLPLPPPLGLPPQPPLRLVDDAAVGPASSSIVALELVLARGE